MSVTDRITMTTKTCTKCGVNKPLSEFGKHRLSKDGHAYRCKECARKASKAYSITSIGIFQNIKGRQEFYKTHDHWRYKPVNLSREDFIEWYESQPKVCHYCGIHETELSQVNDTQNTKAKRLTVDCIDNDRGYSLDNIVLACGRCNFIKNDFFTHEQMLWIGQNFVRSRWYEMLEQTVRDEE